MDIKYLDQKAVSKKSGKCTEELPEAVDNGDGKWYAGQWSNGDISNGIP